MPALSTLGRDSDGQMMGATIFNIMITELVEFLDAKMNGNQITQCAIMAYSEYYWWKLDELKQFYLKVATAEYTSNKNFGPSVLMEYMKRYADERLTAREQHFSNLRPKSTIHPDAKPLTDEQVQVMKDGLEEIAKSLTYKMPDDEYERIKKEYHEQRKATTNPDTDAKCA